MHETNGQEYNCFQSCLDPGAQSSQKSLHLTTLLFSSEVSLSARLPLHRGQAGPQQLQTLPSSIASQGLGGISFPMAEAQVLVLDPRASALVTGL